VGIEVRSTTSNSWDLDLLLKICNLFLWPTAVLLLGGRSCRSANLRKVVENENPDVFMVCGLVVSHILQKSYYSAMQNHLAYWSDHVSSVIREQGLLSSFQNVVSA